MPPAVERCCGFGSKEVTSPKSPRHRRISPEVAMPQPRRVQYPENIEPLVQFIEDTPPEAILDRALEKLRAGLPIQTALTASALAVSRSTEMPPGHHGGPLHPLAGLYAVSQLAGRLSGEQRFVPVLQHMALSNKHINHPAMR